MPRFALNNKREVEGSTLVGCFHCCNIYKPEEIHDYTDDGKTCICPRCGVDAVVGDMGLSGEINEEKLRRAQFYWFKKDQNSSSLRS